jgi:hypothetical protein
MEFPSENQNVYTTFERMKIEENCQRTTFRKSGRRIERYVICGLGRHLAAEFTFSQNTREQLQIYKKCKWTLYRESDRGMERCCHFLTKTPPSGRENVKTAIIKGENFLVYS